MFGARQLSRLLLSASVASLALLSGGAGSASAAQPIIICNVDDHSSATADAGRQASNSMRMAVDAANASPAAQGRKIEIIEYDNKTDPQLAATFATRCAEDDKAALIIGGMAAVPATAIIPVATQYKIPFFLLSAATDNLTDPPAPFHFRFGPQNRQIALAAATMLAGQGFKSAAVIGNSLPFGIDGTKAITAALKLNGIDVVATQSYDTNAADLSPQIINLRGANPEVIVGYSYPADGARVMRALKQLGVKRPFMLPGVGLLESTRKLAGEAADGVLVPNAADLERSDVLSFFDAYDKRFKPSPRSYLAIMGYDAGKLAAEILLRPEIVALIDAGKLAEARVAIRDAAAASTGFKGLQGKPGASYQFSKDQRQGPTDDNWFSMTAIADGGTKLVPADLRTFKPER